jgi:starch synthase (maltosyl-transferring)
MLAPDLPADRVHFLGPRDDVPALLAGADVLVLTSNSEGCPNAVLEALGVGTPIVATDVGDVSRMVVRGESGWIAPPGDADGLVAAIELVLAQGETARAQVRRHWPALEAEFAVDSMVSRTVRLWDTLLRAGR